jgi:hypothetical protein
MGRAGQGGKMADPSGHGLDHCWIENLWLLMMPAVFALLTRFGVVARQEAYLERKFGEIYRVSRHWL